MKDLLKFDEYVAEQKKKIRDRFPDYFQTEPFQKTLKHFVSRFPREHQEDASQPIHNGSSPTLRSDRIDLSLVRKGRTYDKLGGRNLIQCLKRCYFKDSSYPMTRERCEDFFNNDDNFLLSD